MTHKERMNEREEYVLIPLPSTFVCLSVRWSLSSSKCDYELREHEHERLCELNPHPILSLFHVKCMVNKIDTKCGKCYGCGNKNTVTVDK